MNVGVYQGYRGKHMYNKNGRRRQRNAKIETGVKEQE